MMPAGKSEVLMDEPYDMRFSIWLWARQSNSAGFITD